MNGGAPNAAQPRIVQSRTEEELLLAEMAYSPAFRRFIEFIVAPRITKLRQDLLRNADLSEVERRACVLHLLGIESLINDVFEPTEVGEPPAWVKAIFR